MSKNVKNITDAWRKQSFALDFVFTDVNEPKKPTELNDVNENGRPSSFNNNLVRTQYSENHR